ncbi:MAG: hypothetical protein HN413_15865 [Chloroflexi bacterium]|nr:hypothetical protein [Chloroflexota bacterium]
MTTKDKNTEISAIERQRIDDFNRELALALKRIFREEPILEAVQRLGSIQANSISDQRKNTPHDKSHR